MFSNILSKIHTTDEANKLFEEIDLLKKSLYEDSFDQTLKTKIRSWISQVITEELSKSKKECQDFLEDLRKRLEKFKILNLTLAYELTEDSLSRICSFVRENIGPDVLLDISYVPNLIGGATIIYEGKYRDFSLRRLFEMELDKSKEEIMSLLRSEKRSEGWKY